MAKRAPKIDLSPEERDTLGEWARCHRTEPRFAFRARVILHASEGMQNKTIAAALRTRAATVSKWRSRFAEKRIAGLQDGSRPGAKRVYDEQTERRILDVLNEPSPRWRVAGQGLARAPSARDSPATTAQLVRQHRSAVCGESSGHCGHLP